MTKRKKKKGRRHRVAPTGAAVFPEEAGDERPVHYIPIGGGRYLKGRLAGGPSVRSLGDDEYCGRSHSPDQKGKATR